MSPLHLQNVCLNAGDPRRQLNSIRVIKLHMPDHRKLRPDRVDFSFQRRDPIFHIHGMSVISRLPAQDSTAERPALSVPV